MYVVYMYGCMNVREVRDYVCGVYVWFMNVREVRDYLCGIYVWVYECERSSRLCVWCICMGVRL